MSSAACSARRPSIGSCIPAMTSSPAARRFPTTCRSQMAMGFFEHLAGDRAIAWSGGSKPGSLLNPAAVKAMREIGIDISEEFPKPWTDEVVRAADVVVTMGCGDACPVFPGKRYEDWTLDDPEGQDVAAVRLIRDQIEQRVRYLLDQIGVPAPA